MTAFIRKSLSFVLLLMPMVLAAAPIDEQEALRRAQAFMHQRGKVAEVSAIHENVAHTAAKSRGTGTPAAEAPAYYVFNVGSDDGFVIVSADDRTPTILGYADSGSINMEALPDGLLYMLDGYTEQIRGLQDYVQIQSHGAKQSPASAVRTPITPMITSHWNQSKPYNYQCPEIDGERTVTGCVVTAMAQLMYFHKWPQDPCTSIPGYTITAKDKNKANVSLTVDGVDATTFGWNDMKANYADNETGTAADAVAQLMKYCGVAVCMKYGLSANGGSAAYSEAIPYALKEYFGYDGGVHHTYRKNYDYVEWVNLIYSELAEGRPVALGGQSMGGGHAFVCDGYDTDDYFHINWGWGGESDGYFRLSVLQPREQGIGGSSTLDGFSFTQNAIIGIQPPVSGNKDYCLSLESMFLSSSGDESKSSKTYTRDAETHEFTDISIYGLLYDYYQGSHTFDYALQLVDATDNVVNTLCEGTTNELTFNKSWMCLHSVSISSDVADGTYYIKIVSRLNGTTEWMECCDGDRYQMTAVISGDELTISVPRPFTVVPTAATISVEGNLTKGYEQQVTATITGGSADYHDNVFLGVNGKAVMGKTLDIPAGETVTARFAFTPTAAGETTLSLYTARNSSTGKVSGTQIGTNQTMTIAESDATDQLDLTFSTDIHNINNDTELYGNAFHATVTVSNPSTTNSYAGQLNCSVRKWTITTTDNGDNTFTTNASYESIGVTSYPLVVDKEGTAVVNIARDDLELTDENTRYSVRLTYRNTSKTGNVANAAHLGLDANGMGAFTVVGGYRLGDASGNVTIHQPASTIDATDACFADLRGVGTVSGITAVTPSSNPNCVYLMPEGTAEADIPASLSGKNVVCGTVASTLTLSDGYDFYTPIAFTADNATYTRCFDRAASGTKGWNTLLLPFTVDKVSCPVNGETAEEVTWFKSDTGSGNFWLRAFRYDSEGSVAFGYTEQIAANTPYIIAVPDDRWDTEQQKWKMTGKDVTFSATGDVAIAATSTVGVSGNHYRFAGTTVATTVAGVYVLNEEGSKFMKADASTPVDAFRAWFAPVNITSLTLPALLIVSPDATAIALPSIAARPSFGSDDGWYTLSGVRLSGKPSAQGLYIHNGKKVVVMP